MNKVTELTNKNLWTCPECGRMEYADYAPDCQDASCMDRGLPMITLPVDARAEFEAIGQHFYRDTGFIRPGKDCRKHDIGLRQMMFENWNNGVVQ